jgi:hypothetical protein
MQISTVKSSGDNSEKKAPLLNKWQQYADGILGFFKSFLDIKEKQTSRWDICFSGKGFNYGYNLRWRTGKCNRTLDFVTEGLMMYPGSHFVTT